MTQYNVVIIDDSADDCLAMERQLSKDKHYRYSVRSVHDFDQGVDAMLEQKADVYFVDLNLNGRSGMDILRRAALEGNTKPLIMVTGNDNPVVDMQALELGATDFINKSELSTQLLSRTIRHAIIRKTSEIALRHAATHDALTELAHKKHFESELMRAIARHERSGNTLGLLLIDLDRFKPINDTYGHSAGDALLKQVASGLIRSVRAGDLVGRLGGDEFGVLIEAIDGNDLERFIDMITACVENPIHWRNCELQVGCSVGAAIYPKDASSASNLIEVADQRMYLEKYKKVGTLASAR